MEYCFLQVVADQQRRGFNNQVFGGSGGNGCKVSKSEFCYGFCNAVFHFLGGLQFGFVCVVWLKPRTVHYSTLQYITAPCTTLHYTPLHYNTL